MKNNKNTLFNKLFILLLGMFFFIAAFSMLGIEKDKIEYMETNGEPAEATIVRFNRSVRVTRSGGREKRTYQTIAYIAYSFEGEEYEGALNYYSFLMKKGDTIEILVDPDNPKSFIESDNNNIKFLYVMMFIGAALPVSAFIPDVVRKLKSWQLVIIML